MDRRIRELERRASQGDPEAQQQLINHWGRAGLVPTNEHIDLMSCGFARGRSKIDPDHPELTEGAAPAAIKIWCNLLRGLAEKTYNYDMQHLYPAAATRQEIQWVREEADEDIDIAETTFFPSQLHLILEESTTHSYIDRVLDVYQDLPPLYMHYNDLTDSLHLGYLDVFRLIVKDVPHRRLSRLFIIFRKIPKVVAKEDHVYQVELSWDVNETDQETIKLFSNLPQLLQEQPGVWDQWGWGERNNRTRHMAQWDYEPMRQNLDSMHWLST